MQYQLHVVLALLLEMNLSQYDFSFDRSDQAFDDHQSLDLQLSRNQIASVLSLSYQTLVQHPYHGSMVMHNLSLYQERTPLQLVQPLVLDKKLRMEFYQHGLITTYVRRFYVQVTSYGTFLILAHHLSQALHGAFLLLLPFFITS